jgi:hypothetical protein
MAYSRIDRNKLVTLLQDYFEKCSQKPSCYQDLQPYTELEGEELQSWKAILDSFSLSLVRGPVATGNFIRLNAVLTVDRRGINSCYQPA